MSISKDLETGIDTRVPLGRERIREAARTAAQVAGGWSFKGGVIGYSKVSEVREAERGLTFAVSAPGGQRLLVFRVLDEQTAPAQSVVRVGIGDHLQVQQRGALGIPTDRRRVAGFGSYAKFVRAFANELEKRARSQP
jgi:hypothetical protein